jgi:hypothetical protein
MVDAFLEECPCRSEVRRWKWHRILTGSSHGNVCLGGTGDEAVVVVTGRGGPAPNDDRHRERSGV